MARLFANSSSLLRTIVPETAVASTVSPSVAILRASLSVPGPPSAVLVTVIVAACKLAGAAASKARQATRARVIGLILIFMFFSFLRLCAEGQCVHTRQCDIGRRNRSAK